MNLYAYCNNDPVNLIDVNGNYPFDVHKLTKELYFERDNYRQARGYHTPEIKGALWEKLEKKQKKDVSLPIEPEPILPPPIRPVPQTPTPPEKEGEKVILQIK